jgi:signal transduction histidine kinase
MTTRRRTTIVDAVAIAVAVVEGALTAISAESSTGLHRLIGNSAIDARLVGNAPDHLEPPVQRAIYRTIQEALTNVRKHAPGAGATIDISQDDTDLTVTVTNTSPTGPTLALPSARHGLVGLQERAALLGGKLHTGPTPDGGFQLRLRLPLTARG